MASCDGAFSPIGIADTAHLPDIKKVSPATVIGSLLFLFLTLLVMAIAVSLYDAPRPARKATATGKAPRQEIRPVVLNRAERMELIESTRNMVVTHPAGVARLVRNWISDGS